MPFETHELERIKAALADYIVAQDHKATLRDHAVPLLDAIDRAADDPTDPQPFAHGKRVMLADPRSDAQDGLRGVVVKRVETDGELHTILVRWEGGPGVVPYSPIELRELSA